MFNPHREPGVVLLPAIPHSKVKVGELAGVLGQDGQLSEFQVRQGYRETLSHPNQAKPTKPTTPQANQNKRKRSHTKTTKTKQPRI